MIVRTGVLRLEQQPLRLREPRASAAGSEGAMDEAGHPVQVRAMGRLAVARRVGQKEYRHGWHRALAAGRGCDPVGHDRLAGHAHQPVLPVRHGYVFDLVHGCR